MEAQRSEFVELALQPGSNRRDLCRRFEISPSTGYKWIERVVAQEGCSDRSKRPHSSPRRTALEVETWIVEARLENPTWGARKLKAFLQRKGAVGLPSPSTITQILRRHELLNSELTGPRDFIRFEKEEPNLMWQMDFKGDFAIKSGRCFPFTLLDDHSRYLLSTHACERQSGILVQSILTVVFRRYGLPLGILCDNGGPWGSTAEHRLTPLVVWLLLHDVSVRHGRPYHPQTQGKLERLHRTLKEDEIEGRSFDSLEDCQAAFDRFRHKYNHERPHDSLSLGIPADYYRPSLRLFPEKTPEPTFEAGDIVRKVQLDGIIHLKGKQLHVPKALIGYPVGLRESQEDGVYDVHFARRIVAQVNLRYNPTP